MLPLGRETSDTDAAFYAGIALEALDDLVRLDPSWLEFWRDWLALKSAAVAARMLGHNADEHALRDALLLTAAEDDPGPAGKLFFATRMLARRFGSIGSSFTWELAALLDICWDDGLAAAPDRIDSAIQSGRAAPFAVADL